MASTSTSASTTTSTSTARRSVARPPVAPARQPDDAAADRRRPGVPEHPPHDRAAARARPVPRRRADRFALPLVLSWDRSLELDQRDSPCTFDIPDATCVSRMSSSTLADGLLPMAGYDGQNGGAGFTAPIRRCSAARPAPGSISSTSASRLAPMNQLRDDTKPTWKLGAELRLGVGKVAALDRVEPTRRPGSAAASTSCGCGPRSPSRIGWAEPFVDVYWQLPIAIKDGSPFASPGFGARSTDPSQRAGARFGFEAYAVDQGDDGARLSLELSARLDAHFEGREHTEMWEVFALAGDASGGAAGARRRSAGRRHPGPRPPRHHHGRELPRHRRPPGRRIASASGSGSTRSSRWLAQTEHVLDLHRRRRRSAAVRGRRAPSCEVSNDDLVSPGTNEVSPLHVPLIDLIGHRYHVDELARLRRRRERAAAVLNYWEARRRASPRRGHAPAEPPLRGVCPRGVPGGA
jgi:hypothetical protein